VVGRPATQVRDAPPAALAEVLLYAGGVRALPALLVACALGACTESPPGTGGPNVTSRIGEFTLWVGGRGKLDVLFVVDRSPQMAPYQAGVLGAFPRFAEILAAIPGGAPDLNIAVASGDLADGGALRTSAHVDGSFVIDGWRNGARAQNYTGELGSALAELADVGITGDSQPRLLDVVPLALAAPEFVREHAYLAVVVIAASDDASTIAVDALATQLKQLKADPAKVLVIGIYPKPADRLDALLAAFPNRSDHTPIDANDLGVAFRIISQLHAVTLGIPCLDWAPLDLDPVTEGGQYDCSVEHTADDLSANILARCGGGALPCWDIVVDPMSCQHGDGFRAVFEHGALGLPWEHATLRGQCLIE
jgi:hypothetical protein